MKLSEKIKELRNQHGLSQEELAKQAQLSLRTIQRIELNETEARGDTLKRLAEVFDLQTPELTEIPKAKDKYFIPLLNLSAFSFIIFPLLGFMVPLILWVLKKNPEEKLEETGKEIVNFQTTWGIVTGSLMVMFPVLKILHIGGSLGSWLVLFIIFFYILNGFLILFNAIRIRNHKSVFYKPAISFLK